MNTPASGNLGGEFSSFFGIDKGTSGFAAPECDFARPDLLYPLTVYFKPIYFGTIIISGVFISYESIKSRKCA
jgi:hypothetical protein